MHNNGKESEMNRLFEWQDELAINESIEKVEEIKMAPYLLQGTKSNGEIISREVTNMRLAKITCSSGVVNLIGCSESILDTIKIENDNADFIVSIWIKGNEPLANPIPGIYIASQEFPTDLIY